MLSCINKKSAEYQILLKRSGLSDYILNALCRDFLSKYDRFPHLDELEFANSEQNLREELNVKDNNSLKVDELLSYTGKDSVEDANIEINNQFRDLEVEILPIVNEAIINIKQRPNLQSFNQSDIEVDKDVSDVAVMNDALYKLAKLYGIKFNTITNEELKDPKWDGIIQNSSAVKGFIYNGEIYINIDNNSVDAPLHEMMHLFVGSLRFTNTELYLSLVSLAEQLPNYKELIAKYPNRTRNDVNEEIIITEVSNMLAGLPSSLNNISSKLKYEISYNFNRVLDSILMGESSVKSIDNAYNLSLKSITQKVNSSIMTNKFKGLSLDSELHRKLNNVKQELIKNKELEEYCGL